MTEIASLEIASFEALRAALAALPDQVLGRAASLCETGDPYVEFFSVVRCRPEDVSVAEQDCVSTIWRYMSSYLDARDGRIYWRMPFESDISPWSVVARYADDGPDLDFTTGQRCHLDKNWMKVSAYARLYRSEEATLMSAPDLSKYPEVWCGRCNAVRPLVVGERASDPLKKYTAVDLICAECASIIATLHETEL